MKAKPVQRNKTGFQFIDTPEIILREVERVVIFGDPGCTGFYEDSKKVLGGILKQKADAFFVLGDLAFTGSEEELREVIEFCDTRVQVPIYCLCGNHDLPYYPKLLGRSSYALILDAHVCCFLDNSGGYFSENDFELLRKMLQKYPDKPFVLLMHIPPPLTIGRGSLEAPEWEKIKTVIGPHAGRIRRIFCSHLHGFYEYQLDGYEIMLTAGGGAAMIHKLVKPALEIFHSVLADFQSDGSVNTRLVPVEKLSLV